ncbi:TAXI family TRAP transporter solute-binding subunit [Vreelandella zhaodongensis]|uniref:TAXI family TRAP transporter solute-binding subunit n=1 Tax=Vreelandella zhaodongensis TaxID=1176240 RepID=UPI003EC06E91
MAQQLPIRTLLAGSILALAVATPASAQEQIGFATTASSSGWYSFYASLATIANRGSDVMNVSVIETGGAADSQAMVHAGQTEMGIANFLALQAMMEGTGDWEGRANDSLRAIAILAATPNVLAVHADSGIESVEDLAGKRINPGGLGSATEDVTIALFEKMGIEPDWQQAGMSDAADFFRDRRIDGFFKTSGAIDQPDSLIEELQATLDINMIGFSPEQAEMIEDSGLALTFEVPAGVYANQPEPIIAKGLAYGYFARSDSVTEQMAYDLAEATFGSGEAMAAIYPGGNPPDFVELTLASNIPLHAGVVQWLMEQGIEVPESIIPPEFEG